MIKKSHSAPVSFWDHLEVLRWSLFRILGVFILLALVLFFNKEFLFNQVILAPNSPAFLTNRFFAFLAETFSVEALRLNEHPLTIISVKLNGQFMAHLTITAAATLICTFPYIVWEIWRFISPAMYEYERKNARWFILSGSFFFFLGVLFGYYIIVPITLNFLGGYSISEMVTNQIVLGSYVGHVVTMTLMVGAVFELPVISFLLCRVGVITPNLMKKHRNLMYVILLIFSAVITPPDVLSQLLICGPMIGLYEFSISIARFAQRKEEVYVRTPQDEAPDSELSDEE